VRLDLVYLLLAHKRFYVDEAITVERLPKGFACLHVGLLTSFLKNGGALSQVTCRNEYAACDLRPE
jgi:hypothetical protein